MSDIDIDNTHLLKEVTNLLLQRVKEALGSQKDFKEKKDIFGQAAPFLTIKGTGEMIEQQSQVKTGRAPAAISISEEDEKVIKTMAAHARQRTLNKRRLPQLSTPEAGGSGGE